MHTRFSAVSCRSHGLGSLALLYSPQVQRHATAIARAYTLGVRQRIQRTISRALGARIETAGHRDPPLQRTLRNRAEPERAVRGMQDELAAARSRRSQPRGERGASR